MSQSGQSLRRQVRLGNAFDLTWLTVASLVDWSVEFD